MNEALGQYLKRIRKERNLTLRAVEEKTSISNAYLSQIENCKIIKPSPLVLHRLAEFYNIPYKRLMELSGYPLPELEIKEKPAFRMGSSFDDLTDEEKKRVLEYIEFLQSRKR